MIAPFRQGVSIPASSGRTEVYKVLELHMAQKKVESTELKGLFI